MAESIITLTTDFGVRSPFVAAMKGVILSINPSARLVDLSHEIPPFDLRHAAFFLAEALPYFPTNTLHVVVVDPEVGSDRDILFVSVANQRILVPDNGCWTLLTEGRPAPLRVLKLTESRFWRPTVSSTFHGRDVFAPVAAYLSLGINPGDLGPPVTHWRELSWPTPVRSEHGIVGEIIFVDHFGNLISNVAGNSLPDLATPTRVRLGDAVAPRVRTYADAAIGDLVSLVSSSGLLEVAVVQGSAAKRLAAKVGTPLHVEWDTPLVASQSDVVH